MENSSVLDIALIATGFKITMKGCDMVKKIKIKQKAASEARLNWKVIVAIIGVLGLIILIFVMIGQAGLESSR